MKKIFAVVTEFTVAALAWTALVALAPQRADAQAPNLTAIEKQLARNPMVRAGKSKSVHYGQKYFDKYTNFYKVFETANGPKNLLNWIGITTLDYSITKETAIRAQQLAQADRVYVDKHLTRIEMLILVPHPKYRMTVESGLQPDFSKLTPPELRVKSSTKIDSNGFEGTLYEQKKGGCSLIFNLPQDSLIQLSVTDCANKALLGDLADHLDLERLKNKLES
jgi:hypothetical protein